MRQRLLLTAIICTLTLGDWGGVLASVLCPHAGNIAHAALTDVASEDVASEHETRREASVHQAPDDAAVVVVSTSADAHDCCRVRLPRAKRPHTDGDSATRASHGDSQDAHATPHPASADMRATAQPPSHEAPHEDQRARAKTEASHEDGQAGAKTTAKTTAKTNTDVTCEAATGATRAGSFDAPASSSCTHCLSRPGQTPVYTHARQQHNPRRDSTAPAPRLAVTHAPPAAQFIPAHLPRTRGAPPGQRARRHVLHSIFLI